MEWMPIILDVATVLIIFLMVWTAARRGFVSTVIRFAGYLVSAVISAAVSQKGAELVYQEFVRPPLMGMLREKVEEYADVTHLVQQVENLIEGLPKALLNALSYNVRDLAKALDNALRGSGDAVAAMADAVISPTVIGLLQVLLFLVCFSICMFLVRILAGVFQKMRHVPLIGPVNSLLGGIIGFLEALLFLFIAAMVMNFLFTVSGNAWNGFNRGIVEDTFILRNFFLYNPLAGVI